MAASMQRAALGLARRQGRSGAGTGRLIGWCSAAACAWCGCTGQTSHTGSGQCKQQSNMHRSNPAAVLFTILPPTLPTAVSPPALPTLLCKLSSQPHPAHQPLSSVTSPAVPVADSRITLQRWRRVALEFGDVGGVHRHAGALHYTSRLGRSWHHHMAGTPLSSSTHLRMYVETLFRPCLGLRSLNSLHARSISSPDWSQQ